MKIASLFTNGMVLQQGTPVPVWGSASSGSTVTVRFAGQQFSGTAGADGRRIVRLAPLIANAKPEFLELVSSDCSNCRRNARSLKWGHALQARVLLGVGLPVAAHHPGRRGGLVAQDAMNDDSHPSNLARIIDSAKKQQQYHA
jgi:hypothetical protein